jgi:XTP/dITP diphosphohydrolase
MRVKSTVVLASGNPGKLREMAALLDPIGLEILPQSRFNVPDALETGTSFAENALIKARNAARHTGMPALADDSGIEVDALDGAPGVYSARFAGAGATDEQNLELLIDKVIATGVARPAARFQCVIAYLHGPEDAAPIIARGTWHGYIVTPPRGGNGFGYDPVFFVPDHGCTSAQLAPQVKNRISHRGQAMQALLEQLLATTTNRENSE